LLGGFVAFRADGGHDLAALLLCEHVGHGGRLADPAGSVMPKRERRSCQEPGYGAQREPVRLLNGYVGFMVT
jgi:hypothetical protein